MKRSLGVIAALMLALGTAACGPDEPTPDEIFLADYHATFTTAPRTDEADHRAITAAKQTCDALNKGATVDQVGRIAIDNGMTPADAGDLVGMAAKAYCPEHLTR